MASEPTVHHGVNLSTTLPLDHRQQTLNRHGSAEVRRARHRLLHSPEEEQSRTGSKHRHIAMPITSWTWAPSPCPTSFGNRSDQDGTA